MQASALLNNEIHDAIIRAGMAGLTQEQIKAIIEQITCLLED
jgi:hypothetical protein